jgi:hypothetical protein
MLASQAITRNKVVGPVLKKMNQTFVQNPTKRMFEKGLEGQEIRGRGVRRALDTYVMNPLTADAKNLAYDIGRLAYMHNVLPAINKAKQQVQYVAGLVLNRGASPVLAPTR